MLKQPKLLQWIGFSLAVAVCVVLIVKAFTGVFVGRKPEPPPLESGMVTSEMERGFDAKREMALSAPVMPDMIPPPIPPSGGTTLEDQRLIKTGDLNLRVDDVSKAIDDIRSIVTPKKGFLESSSVSDSGTGPRNAWVTVRVPVATFETSMTELKRIAVLVLNESVQGQDVSAEFVDLEANLRNARAEEQSYLEILKRAGDIEDVLAVTARLAEVRGRIERLDAQKRFLENRTDLATITIALTEETRVDVPGKTWQPLEVLRQALRDLVESLQELVNFLIRLVIAIIGLLLPIALLTAAIMWVGWKIVSRILRRFRK